MDNTPTPTPRTDAVGRRAGKIMSLLASHDLRLTEAADEMQDNLGDMEMLETELTAAQAERDALREQNNRVIAVFASKTDYIRELEADLTRLRAIADELAGALESVDVQESYSGGGERRQWANSASMWLYPHEAVAKVNYMMIYAALARYQAIPAPDAANKS